MPRRLLPSGLEHRVITFGLGQGRPSGPGQLEDVLDALPVRVHQRSLPPGVAGRTIYRDGIAHVELDIDASERRATFTLAHELGHVLVDYWRRSSLAPDYVPSADSELEDLCDRIAAELLLPESWFRCRAAEAAAPYLEDAVRIAHVAHVSESAVLTRLRSVGVKLWSWRLMRTSAGSWEVTSSGWGGTRLSLTGGALTQTVEGLPHHRVCSLNSGGLFTTPSQVGVAAALVRGNYALIVAGPSCRYEQPWARSR